MTSYLVSFRGVIAAYRSYFGQFAFLSHPMGEGLGTTYGVHVGLIGKCVVDFLLVIIELFSLCFTVERLSNYRFKISDFATARAR